jgi:hypothetical protein
MTTITERKADSPMRSTTRLLRGLAVVPLALGLTVPASAAPATEDWSIGGTEFVEDSSNVRADGTVARLAGDQAEAASARSSTPIGIAVFAPHQLPTPATGVTAELDGKAELDVRGRLPDGTWSEWIPLPAALEAPATEVQVRAVLTGPDGSVAGITMHPNDTAPVDQRVSADAAGLTYRVYATREGLVGHRTANGHHIGGHDHFVALPSRRGLAGNGKGDYSVRVCANRRCEWAPVWDVGPWNTKDDHWSTPGARQSWKNLPQGMPEAQAAYHRGYNKGKDQYGRKVGNPAGIDLADGTFLNGLKLKGNAEVTVTYQWTGTAPVGTVHTDGIPLNVRSGASSGNPQVGLAANRAQVRIDCKVAGQVVSGTFGTGSTWYQLAPGMFVAAVYVAGGGAAPAC